jgi:hypothetical protein
MLIHQSGRRPVRQFALHPANGNNSLLPQMHHREIAALTGQIIDTWPLCPLFANRWVDELTLLRDQGER